MLNLFCVYYFYIVCYYTGPAKFEELPIGSSLFVYLREYVINGYDKYFRPNYIDTTLNPEF